MEINGREIGFIRTLAVVGEIKDMCPDKDFKRFPELFKGDIVSTHENGAKLIVIMNKAYEERKAREDHTYTPNPLSYDEIMCLTDGEFVKLFAAACEAVTKDVKYTPPRKRKA